VIKWDRALSWSRLKHLMEDGCSRRFEYEVTGKTVSDHYDTHYATIGIATQKIFEEYFKQGIWRTEKGRTMVVTDRVIQKVFDSGWYQDLLEKTRFPHSMAPLEIRKDIRLYARKGFDKFREMGWIGLPWETEKKVVGVYRKLRWFALVDFYHVLHTAFIIDGKATKKMNADPRQLLHYVLALKASGMPVEKAGMLYYVHAEFEPVDVSTKALREYVESMLDPIMPLLHELKEGIDQPLPTNPSPECCRFCNWKSVCPDSAYLQDEVDFDDSSETITFNS